MSFHQPYELHDFEPTDYFGGLLGENWKVSIYQSCMGGILDECNFNVFLERLGGLSETVKKHRVGFSGDGWYEFIAINESDIQAIEKAREMLSKIKDYPILDEDKFNEAEETYYSGIGYEMNENGEWSEPSEKEKSLS